MLQLGKNKVETSRNVLSFRKSTGLHIDNEGAFIEKYPELIKVEIKKSIPKSDITNLIKAGAELEGAVLIEKQNLQVR